MNFEVRNSPREGIWLNNAHNNVFSHLVTHSNHYSGITNYMSNNNRYEYIVTYDNFDTHNEWGKPGDDADGISIHTGDSNVIYRMISFGNSDDGIDAWRSTNTVIDSSISFNNGRGTHGNGNGFKGGGNYEDNHTLITNSISFGNRNHGFDYNSGRFVSFVNNTAFGNGGYEFVAGNTTTLTNNIAQGGPLSVGSAHAVSNSWNLGISDVMFITTNRFDGNFLSLQPGSPAINAGAPTGSGAGGRTPDLGALELGKSISDLVAPVDVVALVEAGEFIGTASSLAMGR